MDPGQVISGSDLPREIHVIVGIPVRGDPLTYEIDTKTGATYVDRAIHAAMFPPGHDDLHPLPVPRAGIRRMRPSRLRRPPSRISPRDAVRIDAHRMEDEKGPGARVLSVPHDEVREVADLPALMRPKIAHAFAYDKDLEYGQWARVAGREPLASAERMIIESVRRDEKTPVTPVVF
ncbi:MAG: inorganic diphosphatase [Acidiferrobacteraceae bacterium]